MRVIVIITMAVLCTGCVRRTVMVTSSPPGALVYLNDREIGRTPVEVDITFYGRYDVRIVRDGYEPVQTYADADAPLWDLPGPDLLAEVTPLDLHSKNVWHFDLEPVDAQPEALADRARAMRESLRESAAGPEDRE